jgi:hypothetical protein
MCEIQKKKAEGTTLWVTLTRSKTVSVMQVVTGIEMKELGGPVKLPWPKSLLDPRPKLQKVLQEPSISKHW